MMKELDPDEMPPWLSSLWEKRLSNWINAGINDDDCAIIDISKEDKFVITTDFLNNSPIGLELGVSSFFDIGRLIVGSNISDLCGTGATPKAFLLGLMFKKGSSENDYKELVKGAKFELDKINIPLIGGDSKLGKENTFYGIAIGFSNNNQKLFTKKEAKVDDNLWVSGPIGNVSAAIYGLTNKIMDEEWETWAKKTINEPILPLEKSMIIANNKIGNGGTDISDGLGADIQNMVKLSNVGVIIDPTLIPIDEHVKRLTGKIKIPAWYFAFIIGGDFQFVVTSNSSNDNLMLKNGMYKIGAITCEHDCLIKIGEKIRPMPNSGHRDIHKTSFSKEVNVLLDNLKKNLID
jgi:thiamine-monophosphate kinase